MQGDNNEVDVTQARLIAPFPEDAPAPKDDGGADHLTNSVLPAIALQGTDGRVVSLQAMSPLTVLYFYPMTGTPGQSLPSGWELYPGARGCTLESQGFCSVYPRLQRGGVQVYGISTQTHVQQIEACMRLGLPFPLLSDASLTLMNEMKLPSFSIEGQTFYRRLTLFVRDGRVLKVFYPVFPPHTHPLAVLQWAISNGQLA